MQKNMKLSEISQHKLINLPEDITVSKFVEEITTIADHFDYRNEVFSNIKCSPELSKITIAEADNINSEELLVIKALVNDLIEMLEEDAENAEEHDRLNTLG